jgi:hypothetical protein
MKKLVFSYCFLVFTIFTQAQIVNIPDANFKTKLLAANANNTIAIDLNGLYFDIDTNNDNQIQLSEALQIKELDLTSASISDLTGITNFINLESLNCNANQLTSLDLHGLPNLNYLCCSNNPLGTLDLTYITTLQTLLAYYCHLTSLNVAGLTNLQTIICGQNQISSLNLINLPHLTGLDCDYNYLSTLSINHLTTLVSLSCNGNQLSTLDVSNLIHLENLQFDYNQLTSIDISHNPQIYSFACSYNHLTSIDLTNNAKLQYSSFKGNLFTELDFSHVTQYLQSSNHEYSFQNNPNLVFVNLKNGQTDYAYFASFNCPNLHYICADDVDMTNLTTGLQLEGVSDIQLNTYCSFVPGGLYNTILGHVTIDTDNNGCDTGDQYFPNIHLNITDGANSGATFTDLSGNYTFYSFSGNYNITPVVPIPGYFDISPATATLNFPSVNNSTQTQPFCVTPIGHHNDVDIVIIPIAPTRPGTDLLFNLVYKNKGNQILSGNIDLTFDDTILDFLNANPAVNSQLTGNLIWNYSNLMPLESRTIAFTLHLNSPTETPPVNIGDLLNFATTINPIPDDETPDDNLFSIQQTVVGSFDPNDKTCLEGSSITPSMVGGYLNYVIRFQNTGSYYAENVVVKDVIDTSKFDINSLQLVASSHPHSTRISGNKVEFIFENINLPAQMDNEPGSHGFVAFKIKTKNNLVLGNHIQNTANIYFDFNAPVVTNTTSTTVALLNVNDLEINSVSITPIPVTDILQINALENITSVQLFDIQGRLLQAKICDSTTTTLDFTGKSIGVYLVKVYTNKGMKVQKVIKN